MNLLDELAGGLITGEGLSMESQAQLFEVLLQFGRGESDTLQGLHLTKQQINHTLKQYRDRLIARAYVQLDGDMSDLITLINALPRLGITPNSPASLLKEADKLMDLPTSKQRLGEIINGVADELEANETINILATELKGK